MDFSTNFTVRTDLADEVYENLSQKNKTQIDGIRFEEEVCLGINLTKVTVENSNGEKISSKPIGEYITIDVGEIWKKTADEFENTAKVISRTVKKMLKNDGLCLVVCLGNDAITSDAIGPLCAKKLIVSRHIKANAKTLFDSLGLGECACIVPGVTGSTGAEAYEIVKGVADILKPSCIIAVDALASRKLSRLAKTVQISNTGICPGSGVGNNRYELSQKTLGIPTISIGVPTVVDAATLCLDMLPQEILADKTQMQYITEKLSQNPKSFYVAPKETDTIIRTMAKLIGFSLNFAFHSEQMTISEMEEFLS